MKKQLFSLFLAMLFVFVLLPAAAMAEGEEPNPPQEEEPFVPDDPTPDPEPDPEPDPGPVGPQAPSVSPLNANVISYVGAAASVSVNAAAYDGSELRYSWYSNTTASNSNGTLMTVYSATAPVSTASAGTNYYYCEVTAEKNGQAITVVSPVITVTVNEIAVSAISVYAYPSTMTYSTGDPLNLSGLQLMVHYNNGSSETLSDLSRVTASPALLETAGTQQIVVSYSGCSCTFPVQVNQVVKVPTSIQLVAFPHQLEYKVNEKLITDGMILRVYYNNDTYEDISSGFTCEPEYLKHEGTQTISVHYDNSLLTTFDVHVSDAVQRIFIEVMPQKIAYTVGEPLDSTGMVIGVVRYSGTSDVVSGFTCSPTMLTVSGTQEVKVTFMGYTSSFYVTVNEKVSDAPAVTPAPAGPATPQPTPETPAPTQIPVVSDSPEVQKAPQKSHTGLIVGIVTAMLVLLAGLGSYALVMGSGQIAGLFRKNEAISPVSPDPAEPEITSDTDPSDDPEIHD
ncbi:MAG: bacterial Ig-like domain-containing protein [Oscillospiraceae bacterium]|nr:bacterial Ig-like domain-containing protein [Oscillospiraceae bacterium]